MVLSLAEPANLPQRLSDLWQDPLRGALLAGGRDDSRATPGHNRWHADIPAVAEVISGGSVRLECQGLAPDEEALLCGPVAIVGAEPGDVIAVDVIGVGRHDGRFPAFGHPGVIGCAPAAPRLQAATEPDGALLGHIRPGVPAYNRVAAQALRSDRRGADINRCDAARLTVGSRILFPVHAHRANLSVGDLHFPPSPDDPCPGTGQGGWIDLRVHLTKRGVERFHITGPLPISGTDSTAMPR